MTKKIFLLHFFTITISHVVFADSKFDSQTISGPGIRFNINVDGQKLPYRIKWVSLNYIPSNLKVYRNKDANSAYISLSRGYVSLINGHFSGRHNPYKAMYPQFAFVKTQHINVQANGSAKLAADGRHVENCKFEWAQNTPIYKNELKDAVRDALIANLEVMLGEKLCNSVNKVVDQFSV